MEEKISESKCELFNEHSTFYINLDGSGPYLIKYWNIIINEKEYVFPKQEIAQILEFLIDKRNFTKADKEL